MLSGKTYLELCNRIDMQYRHAIVNQFNKIAFHFTHEIICSLSIVILHMMVNSCCANGMDIQMLDFLLSFNDKNSLTINVDPSIKQKGELDSYIITF